jgi:4-diphosphocytidyl-2-C-methyl-D-erythritol kinase
MAPGMFVEGDSLTLEAPAKTNLFLEVLGKKANGYHELQSIVVPLSLSDTVTLERTDDGSIETTVEADSSGGAVAFSLPRSADNLTTRAGVALQRAAGYAGGARIRLRKRIPVGGGLGGGSSDAAAVLKGLNRLWGVGLSLDRLIGLAATLGSDIPALIHACPVRLEGQGERVTPIPIRRVGAEAEGWLVLVNPGFEVSTEDIYSRYRSPLTSPPLPYKEMLRAVEEWNLELAAKGLFNGLQETAFRKYPIIRIMAERLEKAGARGVLLSGSGASVFGLAGCEDDARAVNSRVRELLGREFWSEVAQILPDGVMVAHGPLEA